MKANEIRSLFLEYFRKNGHAVVESSALIPQNDPTLMFTSAGMVQFKDCFLGGEVRSYKRAVTAQKCLRAGGKHNDLENVGFTARHHTFFEMLGNFSFGDYFKKDAIHFAWDFVTKELRIPKDRLYVTVFETDDEAAEIWHKQEGVSKDRIYRFGEKDNFWSAGDVGPCGPCSEIFVDRGEKYGNGPQDVMGGDGDRFMEIWNLVFMQYNRDASGKLNPLAKPSIDTGSGLERVASVLQDVPTNYDIDLFQNIIRTVSELAKVKYGSAHKTDVSMRVIADHCRATNFLMADGVLPSNEGRGYVLRRIMRRAIRHGRNLGFNEPFFYKMTAALIAEMGGTYPELKDKQSFLENNIRQEEERFLVTLEHGLKVLDEEMGSMPGRAAAHGEAPKSTGNKIVSGPAAFKLYDTFGFPFDLTQVIAKERGFDVDEAGFQKAMEEQRARSRESWKGSGEEAVDEIYKEWAKKGYKQEFVGYGQLSTEGSILAVHTGKNTNERSAGENSSTEKNASGGTVYHLLIERTPFYAESGGQSADGGTVAGSSAKATVVDVQKQQGLIVVSVKMDSGTFKVGDKVLQQVDTKRRQLTAKNHTATHMLHHALRKFLGDHVKQAGSLVTPDLLRFDFTHGQALTSEQILAVENFINEKISVAEDVRWEEMDKDKAIAKGAIAFFSDKYGSQVRVVQVGDYSTELCGGTHVSNSGQIMAFKILNENGISAGVRRIVAVTGPKVVELIREKDRILGSLMQLLNTSAPEELLPKAEKLLAAEKEARKALEAGQRQAAQGLIDQWIQDAAQISKGGESFQLVTGIVTAEGADAQLLRDLADNVRSRLVRCVVALGTNVPGADSCTLIVAVSKALQAEGIKAGDLVKTVAPIFGGRGGGKPDLAQAGGKDATQWPKVFHALADCLKSNE